MSDHRGLFVFEGSSDAPLARLIETLTLEVGVRVEITAPDLSLLARPPGHVLVDKLEAALALMDDRCDIVFVHRDRDNAQWQERHDEIVSAVHSACPALPWAGVVPVTMTEAWLLLDEPSIRSVAGNPQGRVALGLPGHTRVEGVRDPKTLLQDALDKASEHTGRRRRLFRQDFPVHRAQLLERLDPHGPVSCLPSWARFKADVTSAVGSLGGPH